MIISHVTRCLTVVVTHCQGSAERKKESEKRIITKRGDIDCGFKFINRPEPRSRHFFALCSLYLMDPLVPSFLQSLSGQLLSISIYALPKKELEQVQTCHPVKVERV